MPPLARDVTDKLVDAVAALQQEHRQQRVRVSPNDMLAQLKVRDQAFAAVTVSQVRRAISAANNRGDSMDVEPVTRESMSAAAAAASQAASSMRLGPWHYDDYSVDAYVKDSTLNPVMVVPKLIFDPIPELPLQWPRYLRKSGFIAGNLDGTLAEQDALGAIGRDRRHSV